MTASPLDDARAIVAGCLANEVCAKGKLRVERAAVKIPIDLSGFVADRQVALLVESFSETADPVEVARVQRERRLTALTLLLLCTFAIAAWCAAIR